MLNISFLTPVQSVAVTHLEHSCPTPIKSKEEDNAHKFAPPSCQEGGGNAPTSSFFINTIKEEDNAHKQEVQER